jgi:Tol biopolymer transport system component
MPARPGMLAAVAALGIILIATCSSGEARTTRGTSAQPRHIGSNHCRWRRAHTERVDVSTTGHQANGRTFRGPMSASGRFVAFSSWATNLVAGDDNGVEDVFLRDRRLQQTIRVSVTSTGEEANGPSYFPLLSGNGRWVFFRSLATNLVPGDRNGTEDLFVYDRLTGRTARVPLGWIRARANRRPIGTKHPGCEEWCANAVSANGRALALTVKDPARTHTYAHGGRDVYVRLRRRTIGVTAGARELADGASEASAISANGRFVAFRSFASNLVPGDTNGFPDVFVRDLATGVTERVNVSSLGFQANDVTYRGMLSPDGRFVGFRTRANDLVPDDNNDALDVFVHDRLTHRTVRVSVASDGAQASGEGVPFYIRYYSFMSRPFLSAHGRYAAFTSRASNLVRNDRNGFADVFVHDLRTGQTTRVSVPNGGGESNSDSRVTGISAGGRVVGFMSFANDLVRGDTNRLRDYFVRVRGREVSCASR